MRQSLWYACSPPSDVCMFCDVIPVSRQQHQVLLVTGAADLSLFLGQNAASENTTDGYFVVATQQIGNKQ